jgi:signal-induced proliferation-associated 1 like protein 1
MRGSVLEDAIPSTAKHSTARGLPLKEVLEHVIPELNVQCLRLAFNTPKVTEQLMKLDEQGVSAAVRGAHSCCSGFLLGFLNPNSNISFSLGENRCHLL